MAKTNGSVIEGTVGSDSEESQRTNGSPSDLNPDGRSIKVGDIIEGTPGAREFREFPNLRTATAPDSATAGSGTRRKPGRPPGSGATTKTTAAAKNLDGIEKLLLSINAGVAMLTGFHELAWNEQEAHSVSDAMQEVAKHYDKVIDPKTMAWMHLIGTIGWIEGTRIIAIRARLKDERKQAAPVPLLRPDIPIVKPNGSATGASMNDPRRPPKPSDDPMAYTLNPIKE